MKHTETKIRIGIPETIINDIRTLYGNTIDVDSKIQDILREYIDIRTALEPMLHPDLDAHQTDDEEENIFCSPDVFPDNPGVLNPDQDNVFPVEWNGNKDLNRIRARAQTMFLLDPKDYPVLGRKIMEGILGVVEKPKGPGDIVNPDFCKTDMEMKL